MSGSVSRSRTSVKGKSAEGWSFVLDLGFDGRGRRRQVRRRGFTTKRAAQAALEQARADAVFGQLADPGRLTVEQYLDQWLATVQMTLAPVGFTHYRTIARRYVVPRLGALQLTALTPLTLTMLYADLMRTGSIKGGPLSSATVRQAHKMLHKALKDAVMWGVLAHNPASKASVPRLTRTLTEVWTPEQVATFLATLDDDRMAACWSLAVTTGLRRGELAGLRWADVDLERGVVAVVQQRTTDSDGQVVLGEPKARSRRRVDLGAGTVAALRRHRAAQNAERLSAGPAWSDSGLVFVHPDGSALYPQHLTDLFQRATAAAGLPRIRLHDLRHTAATLALMAGVHPKVVQERLGHSSIAMTLDVYSHVLTGLGAAAAVSVEALLTAAQSGVAAPTVPLAPLDLFGGP